jgi:hypothetical protein
MYVAANCSGTTCERQCGGGPQWVIRSRGR